MATRKKTTTTSEKTEVATRPVGRPSDYRPEYADLMLAHFQMPAWEDEEVSGDHVKKVKGYFPTLASFCNQIGTTQPTLWSWANAKKENGEPVNPEFLIAYNRAKEYQEQYFTQGYMAGKYFNPAIGALIAKNLLNWKDKTEVDQTTTATITSTITQRVELDFSDIVDAAKGEA